LRGENKAAKLRNPQILNLQSRRKKASSGTQTHPPTVSKSQREEGTGGDANKTKPHYTPTTTTTTTCSQIFAATFLMQKQANKQNWIIFIKHLILYTLYNFRSRLRFSSWEYPRAHGSHDCLTPASDWTCALKSSPVSSQGGQGGGGGAASTAATGKVEFPAATTEHVR
jgi:hypothetical protein